MQVQVLFFGQLRDIAGAQRQTVTLAEGSSLADLVGDLQKRFPRLAAFQQSVACSINQEYASPSAKLNDGDEVGLLPPVSGGTGSDDDQPKILRMQHGLISSHCALLQIPIDKQEVVDPLHAPADGALVVFDGMVRDNSRGRPTLYLDYDAYEPMAIRKMEQLAEAALERFGIRDVRVVHRLGRLEIGDTSVLIAVAAAHRAPAFEACRWLIDTLKKTVPIWKKEHFADGAVWADGEPFPEEF